MSEEIDVSVRQESWNNIAGLKCLYCVQYLLSIKQCCWALFFFHHGFFPSLNLGSKNQGFGVLGKTVKPTDNKKTDFYLY